MNRKEGTKHRKRKSNKLKILFWAILFAFVSVLILYLFSLGGENGIAEILNMRDYWLSVGVANGLILIGYLMMYRVDAQNIALNENDLEDTEWLSVKRLKKLKEFQVYDYKAADSKQDGIVIGAEKKGGNVEVITTSQLHALIVGTTGSGKTTGFVDQNIAVLGKSDKGTGKCRYHGRGRRLCTAVGLSLLRTEVHRIERQNDKSHGSDVSGAWHLSGDQIPGTGSGELLYLQSDLV